MKKALGLSLALATAMLIASPAKAAVLLTSWSTTPLAPLVQATPAPITGTVDVNVTGDNPGVWRSPWEFIAACDTECAFNSVRANSTATYAFAQNQSGLNMMWGSPDASPVNWNVLEFFDDGLSVGQFFGAQMSALLVGLGGTDGRGFITLGFTGVWDKVVFSASQNAFEHVFNIRGSAIPEVPLPAGLMLLLSGLLGLGFVGRSRAKTA